MLHRPLMLIAALAGFLGVAAGAFGAHALKQRISPDLLEVFQTGVHYQTLHAVALVFIALAVYILGDRRLVAAGWFFTVGMIVFSGSLYILALTGVRWLGAVTPIGGVCFLAGWAFLALAALNPRRGVGGP